MTLSQPKMSWIFVFLQLALVATTTLAAPTVPTDDFQDFQLARLFNDNLDCGCCFSQFAFDDMVHCEGEDAHLFCTKCVRRAAEEQMGLRQIGLKCMSSDGCESTFERSQFIKALPPKIFDGWQKIRDQECILLAAAENPNLVMCPFCVYAAEIDPPNKSAVVKWNDKEFRCANEECEVVSCRDCKEKSHLPLSCKEAKDLKKGNDILNACHDIEEARSKALFRECECHRPFYKVEGCNLMTCPCGRRICYCCHAALSGHGYDHFQRRRWFFFKPCPMWEFEGTSARNERNVNAAARKAVAKLPRHMRNLVNERTPLLLAPPEPNVMQRIFTPVPVGKFTYCDAAWGFGNCVAGGVIGGMGGIGVIGALGGGGVSGCAATACCWGGAWAFGTVVREKLWNSATIYAYFDGWI